MPITNSTHGMTIIEITNPDVDGVPENVLAIIIIREGIQMSWIYLPLFESICCVGKSNETVQLYYGSCFLSYSYYHYRSAVYIITINLKLLEPIKKDIKMFIMWTNLHSVCFSWLYSIQCHIGPVDCYWRLV